MSDLNPLDRLPTVWFTKLDSIKQHMHLSTDLTRCARCGSVIVDSHGEIEKHRKWHKAIEELLWQAINAPTKDVRSRPIPRMT